MRVAFKILKTIGALAAGFVVGLSLFSDGPPSMSVRFMYLAVMYGVMGLVYYQAQKPFWRQVAWLLLPGWAIGLFFGMGILAFECLPLITGCAIGASYFSRVMSSKVDSQIEDFVDTVVVALGCIILIIHLEFIGWVLSAIVGLSLAIRLSIRHRQNGFEALKGSIPE